MKQSHFEIWTDGACLGNPGPGGWAAIIKNEHNDSQISGSQNNTTNNRMELTAAIKALDELPTPASAIVYTDSTYVRDGLNKWLPNWKNKNWKTASGKPVKNRDLWQKLDSQNQKKSVTWVWVKAHAGNTNNERADTLAREQARRAASTTP